MWQGNGNKYKWIRSSAHLAFLTTFLKPRLATQNPPNIDWQFVLGELPEVAIDRFIASGVIDTCQNKQELFKLKVKNLRQFSRFQSCLYLGKKKS
jgi:hypothetical protein